MNFYIAAMAEWSLLIATLLGQTKTSPTVKTGYASVHGLNLYYEIHPAQTHADTVPLIVLHGGIQSTDSFAALMPALSNKRDVIAVDLQGHGRTADIDRPFGLDAMTDDIAALAEYLHLEKVDVMGYSLGGGVALKTAIRHTGLVRKLVLISTPLKRDGWYPEIQQAMSHPMPAEAMKQSPVYQNYVRIAPHPQDWERLLTKLHQLLSQDYDCGAQIPTIKAQIMLIFADADAIRPAHMIKFFQLLGGGQKDPGWDGSGMPAARLAILPGVTHYNILTAPSLAPMAVQFLDASVTAGK